LSFGYDFRPAFEQSENDAWQDENNAMDNAQVNVIHSHDQPVLWQPSFLSDFCICQILLTFPFPLFSFSSGKY